ncbi:MAG: leucyl/phenylalanyl-tRNA--protein transferase [Balneolaceae bacterium]|nr:leucyl/phenylalanyl-tRNA--protein transferase [Balneolaceae bacterium]MBO6545670.1 leucyl/phenylalanyl-tRNA--protein transferase [Balneolaceae bacterium]MBO6647066.1 leucyl/phenylalanyl-tRNA--protein transferase [Balneolaceae bacterium]
MNIIPPENLLSAYAQGIFPMAESQDSDGVDWYSASKRGVIPIEKFHISKNVLRIIRQEKFEVKVDTRFREVVKACANRETTWINDLIVNSYDVLNQAGHAHSVEVYLDGELVGGLYGVSLQAAFFGESMFKIESEADKVALYYCHQILEKNGFKLWDTQFYTDHLAQFGCIEIDAEEYEERLHQAMEEEREYRFQ